MIKNFFDKIKLIFQDSVLRRRVLFVLGSLVVVRILAAIPIPGVNVVELQRFFADNQFFSLLNVFSGGGLSGLSIIMLGVGPYITASIIMQLSTIVSPKLKELFHENGEIGRKKFAMYSRLITVPLATVQALGFLILLQQQGVLRAFSPFELATNIIVVTAGTILLMWIGELISEFGIGNGTSIIIFAGIVSSLPSAISQIMFTYTPSMIPIYIMFIAVAVITVVAVVFTTEAERPIPITHTRQVRSGGQMTGGSNTYLPLRLNQAGVIPIIFALSILTLPQLIGTLATTINVAWVKDAASQIVAFTSNQLYYGVTYFLLVVLFTYFYTAVTFDPEATSNNLQRSGAFIPGVRPGETTERYISGVLGRITLVGALFLGLIAVLPIIVQSMSGITAISVGGTSLLITVSVVIDIIKKLDGQISLREY
jgi:preprotein translocase subunit SecY